VPTASATPEAGLGAELDEALSSLAAQGFLSGAVLVARDGEVLLSKGYGLADRENNVPNRPETIFRITGVTASFTAMALVLLEEEDRLDLESPLCDFIPNCPEAWQPVTLHHLLTSTSGIPEDINDWVPSMATPTPVEEMLPLIQDAPLLFEPGQRFSYSLWDYYLLGIVVEQASGQPYGDFLRERIFEPLGMERSSYGPITDEWAIGYANADRRAEVMDPSIAFAAAGMVSSVEDLYRWDQALYGETLVPQATLDRIFSGQNPYGVTPTWDYGWKFAEIRGRAAIQNIGYIPGFIGHITRFPDDRVTVISLFNQEDVDLNFVSELIFSKLFAQ
jgi:CubicO group peptidase (beta-lactamase class C family)